MLAFFAGPLGKWAIIGILVAAAALAGFVKGNAYGTAKLDSFIGKQATEALRIAVVRDKATARIITKYIKVAGATRVVTNTIEKEVIRYEAANLDACPLSAGARSLHDGAANNTVPDSSSTADGTPTGLKTAALVKTCPENYATYHQSADRLRSLQEWVRAQATLKD